MALKKIYGPLPPVYVDVSVDGGLDAKQDRKIVKAPATLTADNVQYATAGSVRKRYGINFIKQPSVNNTQSLGSTNDELLASDQSYMYSYQPTDDNWVRRGVAAQCAIGAKAIGAFQLPTSATNPDAQVRSLSYDVIGDIGLAAYDTQDKYENDNGNSQLGSIFLICFNKVTGKQYWSRSFNRGFISQSLQYDCMPGGTFSFTAFGGCGVGHPTVVAFKGKFYLYFVIAATGVYQFNGQPRGAYVYPLACYRIDDIYANNFSMSGTGYTNCTRITFGSPEVIPANIREFMLGKLRPVLFYDVAQTSTDMTVIVTARMQQNQNGAEVPVGTAGGLQMFSVRNATQNAFDVMQRALLPAGLSANVITMDASPVDANGNTPDNGIYVAATPQGLLTYRIPYRTYGASNPYFQNSLVYTGVTPTSAQPISVKVTDNGTTYESLVTDGCLFKRHSVSSITGTATEIQSDAVGCDYAINPLSAALSGFSSYPAGNSCLQSRIFTAPDGQLVAWILLQIEGNNFYNCLALVSIGSNVTPNGSVYAHAFYFRAGQSAYQRQACAVRNGAVLALELTDIVSRTGVLKYLSIASKPYSSFCKLYQGALITGGDTKYYDGKECRTAGWLKSPEIPYLSAGLVCDKYTPVPLTYPAGVPPQTRDDFDGKYSQTPNPNSRYNAIQDPTKTNVVTRTNYPDGTAQNRTGVYYRIVPSLGNYNVTQPLVASFAYSYIFVYVDYDAYGNAIYSSPSNVIYLQGTGVKGSSASASGVPRKQYAPAVLGTSSLEIGASKSYMFQDSSVFMGQPYSGTFTEIYRVPEETYTNVPYLPAQYGTLLNPTRGKMLIYRNSSLDVNNYHLIAPFVYLPQKVVSIPAAQFSDYYPGYNSQTPFVALGRGSITTTAGYYDLTPDDCTQNSLVYSQPATNLANATGEMPNDPPPPSAFAVTTTKRPFVASAENRTWLYPGKPYFPGRAPEFNAGQFIEIDPPSGDITGLAVLDQNVIIFKRDRIFVLAGEGPDATGAGVFNNTYPIATDTGCIDSASIVATEKGVYFRSIRGIQMIDRSLQVTYPGVMVERIVNGSEITSSVLVPAQNQIRWALRSKDNSVAGTQLDNVVLVFDYLQGKWSQYRFNPGYDPRFSLRVEAQTLFKGNPFGLAGQGIFQDGGPENTLGVQQFMDGGSNLVPMTIETGWIPLTGPQGWGRLRRVNVLGDFKTPHSLTLHFGYDYNEGYPYSVTYTPAATEGNPGGISEYTAKPGDVQNWRVRAPRQVAQAVRFKLVDNGSGEACVITGLELETSQKSGATRVPDAQSV